MVVTAKLKKLKPQLTSISLSDIVFEKNELNDEQPSKSNEALRHVSFEYSSVAYLSNQFNKVNSFTPSYFKNIRENKRNPIDNPL